MKKFCLAISIIVLLFSCGSKVKNDNNQDNGVSEEKISNTYSNCSATNNIPSNPASNTNYVDNYNQNSSSVDYNQVTITTSSTPNQYSTASDYSGSYSQSQETNQYYDYEETYDCVDGVVVYEGSGDYYIIETQKGYTIAERYSGRLDEGDRIRGELNKYGKKYILNKTRDSETKIYIEEYMLSETSAVEWMTEHDHIK